jgi:hypothetical protein
MITFSNRAGVSGGSELIADTAARTGEQICAFYVREDTVVSVATGARLTRYTAQNEFVSRVRQVVNTARWVIRLWFVHVANLAYM